MIFEH